MFNRSYKKRYNYSRDKETEQLNWEREGKMAVQQIRRILKRHILVHDTSFKLLREQ
jgi:hypothetical protein